MASANFRKSSLQHQSFLVKNTAVAVEHTCHPCPAYINLWHWYFQLYSPWEVRSQSSDWRPSGKIMSAPASTYAAACTADWANFRMQLDAVKCCQCLSLVTHTASLSSMSGVVALSTALSKPSPGLVGENVTSGKKPANQNGALMTVRMQYTGLHTIIIDRTWTVSKGTEGVKVRPHWSCRGGASAEGGVN